jgi:2-keto-3-deoxy-L-rhamnonate aldolase RhmA
VAALFVGPFDLSGSMGLLGQIEHPDVQAAIGQVIRAGRDASMPLGLFVVNGGAARAALDQGFRMIALGTDASYLISAAREALQISRSG